jgi:putative transposase
VGVPYDPDRHHRRSIRLRDYDYASAGVYHVVICAHRRACLFGDVLDRAMVLNEAGRMVEEEWQHLPERFPAIALDAWVTICTESSRL